MGGRSFFTSPVVNCGQTPETSRQLLQWHLPQRQSGGGERIVPGAVCSLHVALSLFAAGSDRGCRSDWLTQLVETAGAQGRLGGKLEDEEAGQRLSDTAAATASDAQWLLGCSEYHIFHADRIGCSQPFWTGLCNKP